MGEKSTRDLEEVLGRTHLSEFDQYCRDSRESMHGESSSFSTYIKNILAGKHMTQQEVFLKAEVPERYGYKLLSGEKRTKQRDIILRICYAAGLTLGETQRALKKYEMPVLYAKKQRDALLMIIFNERPGSIADVNGFLKENGMDPLRTSGFQE